MEVVIPPPVRRGTTIPPAMTTLIDPEAGGVPSTSNSVYPPVIVEVGDTDDDSDKENVAPPEIGSRSGGRSADHEILTIIADMRSDQNGSTGPGSPPHTPRTRTSGRTRRGD